jgi:amino acid adenylation domain-containing protein
MSNQTIKSLVSIDFDPFEQAEFETCLTAIEPQIEIMTSCLIGGDDANRSYNESNSLRITGAMNHRAIMKALQTLVDRHDILRACFSDDGKYCFVRKAMNVDIYCSDLASMCAPEQKNYIDAFLLKNATTAFDLKNGPLFRTALFRLADDVHYLTLTAHHIICDGWSFGILLEELGQLYSAYAQNKEVQLPEAPSFSNYAIEQKKFYQSEAYKKTEQYWIDLYKDDVPVLSVPTDFPRPSLRTYAASRQDFVLDQAIATALKKLGAKAGCSFVTTLLATFELFIHKISEQDGIIIGLPAAGQSATGYHGLVGHCVNLLPIRSELTGDMTFTDFLKKQKKSILDAYDHQLFTFGSLLKKLRISRAPSRVPLVPVVFNVDMAMDNKVAFHGLTHQRFSNPRLFENFEIFLNINGSEQALIFEWSYNTQLFKPGTITKWMADFERLVKELIANPTQPLDTLSFVDQEEIANQLTQLNNTTSPYPKELPLHQLISQQAELIPHKPAVIFQQYQLTYKQLVEAANQLAFALLENGVKAGDTVGLLMDRSHMLPVVLLAVMKTGAAYVPLDPTFPQDRIAFILDDVAASTLLITHTYKGQFQSGAKEVVVEDLWQQKNSYPKEDYKAVVSGQDLVYILYTSGSTGKPKGVRIRHYNLVNFLISMRHSLAISEKDRLLALTTISFDISCLELYLPLLSGALLQIMDTDTARDGRLLLQEIKKLRPTVMQATPSTWQMLLDVEWPRNISIPIICCGGEPLTKRLADELCLRSFALFNLYGPTETTVWSTIKRITENDDIITIGQPISNTQVYILDKRGKPVPQNTVGEIYIAGDGVAAGYVNREDLTKERFIINPFSGKGDLMYRTGDEGKLLATGEIQCLGRIDHQVKIRGFRIELEEIEACLQKQEGVHQAVVIAKEDQHGNQVLVAYIVLDQSVTYRNNEAIPADSASLIARCRQALKKELPAYMVPGQIVVLQSLPLTPNKKIDRKTLATAYHQIDVDTPTTIALQTAEEKLVAAIWENILGVKGISSHDDFFEIGGHSLLAVKMITQLEKQTGIALPLSTLYEYSTVKKIAARLRASKEVTSEGSYSSLMTIRSTGSKKPIYFIHGAFGDILYLRVLAKYMDPDQPIYGLRPIGLNGDRDIPDTVEAFAAQYVSEIVAQNPTGPYILVGYCFGGHVALEMAKQLEKMGKKVEKLIVVDASIKEPVAAHSFTSDVLQTTGTFFKKITYDSLCLLKHPKDKLAHEKTEIKRQLSRIKRKVFGIKHDHIHYKLLLEQKCFQAMNKYIPSIHNGVIHLLRANTRLHYNTNLQYLGWQHYASQGVKLHAVDGVHNSLFLEPTIKETGRVLQECLNESTAERIVKVDKRQLVEL